MPDLNFEVTGVEPVKNGITPLLRFKVRISNGRLGSSGEEIQAVILHAQIQIEAAQRHYSAEEKGRLLEIFGTPEQWGQTMHSRFWTNADTIVGAFAEST